MHTIARKRTAALIALALALSAGSAAAQERINERRALRPGGTVEIENIAGQVRVTAWDRAEVEVTGTLGRGVERLDFTTQGDRARIQVIYPRSSRNAEGADLQIRVPAQSGLQVITTSAGIEVAGVRGSVTARSTSGDVRVSGNAREVTASSTSGSVDVNGERLATLNASTVSGSIRLRGSSGSVDAESVSGSVDITVATPQTRAKTVSGSLALRDVSGNAEVSTVSGGATVQGGRFSRLSMSSVSGGLRFHGGTERGGLYHLNTHSGTVEMRLPANTSADFEVVTFSGSIQNQFGPAATRSADRGPGRELRFTAGQGGARVVANSFSGDVRLMRQ